MSNEQQQRRRPILVSDGFEPAHVFIGKESDCIEYCVERGFGWEYISLIDKSKPAELALVPDKPTSANNAQVEPINGTNPLPSAEEYVRRNFPLSQTFSKLGTIKIAESYAELVRQNERERTLSKGVSGYWCVKNGSQIRPGTCTLSKNEFSGVTMVPVIVIEVEE